MASRLTTALILAGGQGTRLNVLSKQRAKPGVPFGGTYRIIDFVLSNLMHSRIEQVGLLTQYRPGSLLEHVSGPEWWDFVGRSRVLDILPPHTGRVGSDWYRATADAVYQNIAWLRRTKAKDCLILSGDHIYSMDYRDLVGFHRSTKADVTLTVKRMPSSVLNQFGIVLTHGDGEVYGFEEKPQKPRSDLASLGIYVFQTEVLIEALLADVKRANSSHDFGKDVIPALIPSKRVMAYPFEGYWRDVGTIEAFWEANMDLCRGLPECDLTKWKIATNWHQQIGTRPPARALPGSVIKTSLLSAGSRVAGTVQRSILSPGVVVEEGAVVEDSILMQDIHVGAGTEIRFTIVDKNVKIGEGASIGGDKKSTPPNRDYPHHLYSGLTLIGKGAKIPSGCRIGQNCLVADGVDLKSDELPSGQSALR